MNKIMLVSGINKVVVLGAGTMGLQISLITAGAGYQVAVYDASAEALNRAKERHPYMAQWLLSAGKLLTGNAHESLERIHYTTDASEAAAQADLLTESVPEILSLKHTIHRQFEKLCPAHTILTTNTSSLLVSDIDPVLHHPEKFAAMHFHSGMTPLVDIMRGSKTSEQTVSTLEKFVRSIGLAPMVMKKEKAGYLFNTLLVAQLTTALSLAAKGYGEPQDIDRAWMMVTGQSYGPFGSMDAIGIDVTYDIANNANVSDRPDRDLIVQYLKQYIDKGELGEKTGKGFYLHPNPAYRQPGFLAGKNG
ncbi:MAG: 3-hydroxyacyl-CoA dehydrogenase NAD-binding domain-containing protein [Dehalococcoidales bacterium]|nr:3-hydroxyacyl-CoA dehydrogenase NAD-binding domain-containing protein [Dehalococcoidales bacterium]